MGATSSVGAVAGCAVGALDGWADGTVGGGAVGAVADAGTPGTVLGADAEGVQPGTGEQLANNKVVERKTINAAETSRRPGIPLSMEAPPHSSETRVELINTKNGRRDRQVPADRDEWAQYSTEGPGEGRVAIVEISSAANDRADMSVRR